MRTHLQITERAALDLMRDRNRRLVKEHTPGGQQYFLDPGGPIGIELARTLIARPEIQPSTDDGLFLNTPQTYSWRAST